LSPGQPRPGQRTAWGKLRGMKGETMDATRSSPAEYPTRDLQLAAFLRAKGTDCSASTANATRDCWCSSLSSGQSVGFGNFRDEQNGRALTNDAKRINDAISARALFDALRNLKGLATQTL
jgi:hypothetical protein